MAAGTGWVGRQQRTVCVLLGCALLLAVLLANAGETSVSTVEAQVKAAYIYRFAEHIDWPAEAFASSSAPLTIAVVEADQVAVELNQLRQTRQIKGRAVSVRSLRAGDAVSGAQVLYIGALEAGRLKRTLEAVTGTGVLAITDGAGTLAAGSAISFVQIDNRIRFDVSVAHAERNGLKISARLLAVAHKIEGDKP